MRRPVAFSAVLGAMLSASACFGPEEVYTLPDAVTDFNALFATNCAGCHGKDGRGGAARLLNDPLYQALVKKERMIDVISKGVRGTAMPAFAKSAGGMLTDQQVGILAEEMQKRWAKPAEFGNVALPAYDGAPGDATRGEAAYRTFCASCHGPEGKGVIGKGGPVVDPAYLAQVSDQALRLAVIAGRPDLGAPDGIYQHWVLAQWPADSQAVGRNHGHSA